MTGLNFNATQVAPNVGFVAAPKGRYTVIATAAKIEPTKDGSGKIIQWNFVAQGGNSHGRQINLNTTWENQNPKAVELGHGQLSAICHAVGVLIPQDLRQLLNIPFILEIDITPDGKYNQIVAIEPIAGAQQQQQAAPPQVHANPYGGQPQGQQQQPYQQPAPQQQAPYQQPQPGQGQQPYYDPNAPQQGQQQPQYGPPAGAPPQQQGGYQQPAQGGAPAGYQPPQQQQGYQAPPQVMPDPNAPAPQSPQWVQNQVAQEQPPVSGGYQPPQNQGGYGPGPF